MQSKASGDTHDPVIEDAHININESEESYSDGGQIPDMQHIQQSPFGLRDFPDIPSDYPYLDNWNFYASEDRLIQPDAYDISHLNIMIYRI